MASRYLALLSDCLLYCSYHGSWAGDNTSLKVRNFCENLLRTLKQSLENLLRIF